MSGIHAGSKSGGKEARQGSTGGNASGAESMPCSGGGSRTWDGAKGLNCSAFCNETDTGNHKKISLENPATNQPKNIPKLMKI